MGYFNRYGENYRAFIFDRDRESLPVIEHMNDFNSGALHNALEYLRSHEIRIHMEFAITNAVGTILEKWGEEIGLINKGDLTDIQFADLAIERITTTSIDIYKLREWFPQAGTGTRGPFLGRSFLSVTGAKNAAKNFVFSQSRNAVYLIFYDLAAWQAVREKILWINYRVRDSGTKIIIGVPNV